MPLKILFIGDVVGLAGPEDRQPGPAPAHPALGPRPGRLQRRERRRRLGADPPLPRGAGRRRRGRHDHGRPRLPQGRDLPDLRPDRRRAPPGQLPGRLPRPGARLRQGPRRHARRRVHGAGPDLHAAGRRPVPRRRSPPRADRRRHPRDRGRRPRRGDQRQAAARPLPRRPRLRRARHPHPRGHRRRADPARTAPPIRPTSA